MRAGAWSRIRPQATHADPDPSAVQTLRSTSDIDDYPQLSRLKPMISRDDSRGEFEESLENLLQRIELTMTSGLVG